MAGLFARIDPLRNLLAAAALAGAALAATFYAVRANLPGPAERGHAIYVARCASCHGAALQGQPDWHHVDSRGRLPAPPLDGTGHAWRHSDEELFHLIKFSVLDLAGPGYETNMPAFGKELSDPEIRALVAFIRSRWPSGVQAAQSFLNPGHAGMPAHVDSDWRLPADCDEPVRRAPAAKSGGTSP
jgi:mono/diheme cytochrome c family protein